MGVPRKKDVLALEPRREIFDLVRRAPGVHLRGIEHELGLPFGQVLYHLDYLERSDVLVAKRDGGFKRYFVKSDVGRHDKVMIATFRHELPRKIAILLLIAPGLSHREILRNFDVSGSTLSFHLMKMVEAGILARVENGNENRYRIADERAAAKVLVYHRASFLDDAVDRFVEAWLDAAAPPPTAESTTPEGLATRVLHGGARTLTP